MQETLDRIMRLTKPGEPRIAVKNTTAITIDPALGIIDDCDILIEGGKIAALGPGVASHISDSEAVVVDGRGYVVTPGFVDTHRHCWQSQLRQLAPDADYSTYSNTLHQSYATVYEPQDMYVGNLIAGLSALDSGVTTVVDWSHNSRTPDHSNAAIEGLIDSGNRAVHVSGAPRFDAQRHRHPHDFERLMSEYFSGADHLVTLAFGTFRRASTNEIPDRLDGVAEPRPDLGAHLRMARELGLRISVEGCSSPPSSADLIELHRRGELKSDTTYVHVLDLSSEAWDAIAESGGSVSVAPGSAVEILGLGRVFPATQDALDHGVRPSISLDTEITAPSDFLREMRSMMQLQKTDVMLRRSAGEEVRPAPLSAADVLEFGTYQGARANGVDERLGTIAVGKEADLAFFSALDVNTLPKNDPIGLVVSSATPANIEIVLVAGRPVKWNGELTGVSMKQVNAMAQRSRDALLTRMHDREKVHAKHAG